MRAADELTSALVALATQLHPSAKALDVRIPDDVNNGSGAM
jgi:hypothetical protein